MLPEWLRCPNGDHCCIEKICNESFHLTVVFEEKFEGAKPESLKTLLICKTQRYVLWRHSYVNVGHSDHTKQRSKPKTFSNKKNALEQPFLSCHFDYQTWAGNMINLVEMKCGSLAFPILAAFLVHVRCSILSRKLGKRASGVYFPDSG